MQSNNTKLLVKSVMQPPPVTARLTDTVSDLLREIKNQDFNGKVLYFYVVDEEGVLQGTIPTRSLLLAESEEILENITDSKVFSLSESADVEEATETLLRHRLLALPVVDERKRLVGFFDIRTVLTEEEELCDLRMRDEVFQLLGIRSETNFYTHPWRAYAKRMPWIFCNMIGGLACAAISSAFRPVLEKVLLLAMFIPLVLALGEAVSMQSVTQSLQLIRKRHSKHGRSKKKIFFELRVAGAMAITAGITVALLSYFWKAPEAASYSLGLGICLSIVISSCLGAFIPIGLHALRLDPKVASGPVVLTLTDMFTTTVYLSVASCVL